LRPKKMGEYPGDARILFEKENPGDLSRNQTGGGEFDAQSCIMLNSEKDGSNEQNSRGNGQSAERVHLWRGEINNFDFSAVSKLSVWRRWRRGGFWGKNTMIGKRGTGV